MSIDTKFKKGHKINIGRIPSEETRKKMSESAKKVGAGKWMKGKTRTEKTKKRMSESLKGHRGYWLGKKHSEKTRRKIGKAHIKRVKMGLNSFYIDGRTPVNIKIRHSLEYKLWREAVFKRDNYTCVWCNKRGGELNADHIKSFSLYPELRFSIDNGRTLCIDCHKKTMTYLNNRKKTELLYHAI